MERIQIRASLSAAAAARHGIARYGTVLIEPTDEQWAAATPALREYLVKKYVGTSDKLLLESPPSWEAVVQTASAELAASEKVDREIQERRDKEIAEALAKPDDEWICTYGDPPYARAPYPVSAKLSESDPRLIARLAQVRAGRLVEYLAEQARRRAEQAELAAAAEHKAAEERRLAEARVEAFESALVELAKREDDLARAATEGYDVRSRMLDRLAERLVDAVGAPEDCVDVDTEARDPDARGYVERVAPRAEAFALLDRVTVAVKAQNETLPAVVGRWKVSRILHLDMCRHDRRSHKVTAILATLETPRGTREITFATEAVDCGHEAKED